MKRVQCIKNFTGFHNGFRFIVPDVFKDDVCEVEVVGQGRQVDNKVYELVGKKYRYDIDYFRELASDEELEAYRDKVEQLQFKEITALEIVYQKIEV